MLSHIILASAKIYAVLLQTLGINRFPFCVKLRDAIPHDIEIGPNVAHMIVENAFSQPPPLLGHHHLRGRVRLHLGSLHPCHLAFHRRAYHQAYHPHHQRRRTSS